MLIREIEKKREVTEAEIKEALSQSFNWKYRYELPPDGEIVNKEYTGTFSDLINHINQEINDEYFFLEAVKASHFKMYGSLSFESGLWIWDWSGEAIQVPETWDADLVAALLEAK